MIYVVSACHACPFFVPTGGGSCSGRFPDLKVVDVDPASTKPEWCPAADASLRIAEGGTSQGLPAVLVENCPDCPFFFENEKRRCNVANPKGRPILSGDERPVWCTLRKEVIIVRS